jgi:uncharacterized protein (TIGR02246 family)
MRRIIVTAVVGLAGLALALGQAPPADGERAVRAAIDSYTTALEKGDLDGLLVHIAADADYIDDVGNQYRGKAALGEVLKQSLAELKSHKLKSTITSLRFLRPDVVIADGKVDITGPDGTSESGRFTSTWTMADGKWYLSSVRDLPETPPASDSVPTELKQFEWLIGDWASEAPTFSVDVGCRWTLNKSFLQLEYTVKDKNGDGLTVVQFFGWDPVDGVIRSWFFDSQGGYGGGDWERQGNTWSADWSGVLADGQAASSVNSIQFVDDKTFLFRSVDRDIGGMPMADVEAKFVRKATGK